MGHRFRIRLGAPGAAWGLAVLAGCAGTDPAPAVKPAPALTAEQRRAMVEAERLYRAGDPAFAEQRDRLAADPATAYSLTRMLVYYLVTAVDRLRATDDRFLATVAASEDPALARAEAELIAMGAAAVPALVQDLLYSYPDRRELGIRVLARMGPVALPGVEPLLQDPDWRIRRAAVAVAAATEPVPEAAALLGQGASDESFAVRAEALVALLRHGGVHLERARRALAEDPDPFVRRTVAAALADHPDRATAAALVAYYEDCRRQSDHRGVEAAEASLIRISGHTRRGDPSFWRSWVQTYAGGEAH